MRKSSSSPQERSSPVLEGEILAGKYRVARVLGVGGMGVVVEGLHLELDKRVAIKFLRADALADDEAVQRFAREARAAVRLKSEHVARVHDVGRLESGSPFMVMELLEGEDLGAMLDRGDRPEISDAVDYVLQACEAIAEAHSLGIIHRDLKPRNLFLSRRIDGRPIAKVLDFGISKLLSPDENHSLTRTSDVMGSPSYMSPEQLRSARNVTEKTDIWALGVILYELLTGRLPFASETVTELVLKIVQDTPPSICKLRPEVPVELEAAVMRALEKDADNRFASIGELAHALEPFTAVPSAGVAARIETVGRGLRSRPSAPVPRTARVSVTGGTSVSWGETEVNGATEVDAPSVRALVDSALPVRRARGATERDVGPPARKNYLLAAAGVVTLALAATVTWRASVRPPMGNPPSAAAPPLGPVLAELPVPVPVPTVRRPENPVAMADAAVAEPTVAKITTSPPSERKMYPAATPQVPVPPHASVRVPPGASTNAAPVATPAPPSTEKVPTGMPDERK